MGGGCGRSSREYHLALGTHHPPSRFHKMRWLGACWISGNGRTIGGILSCVVLAQAKRLNRSKGEGAPIFENGVTVERLPRSGLQSAASRDHKFTRPFVCLTCICRTALCNQSGNINGFLWQVDYPTARVNIGRVDFHHAIKFGVLFRKGGDVTKI